MNRKVSLTSCCQVLFVAAAALLAAGCKVAGVDAGHEGVVVKRPWFFGASGVDPIAYPTGTHFLAPTTSFGQYPIRPLKIDERFTDLVTSDRTPVDFSSYINVQLIAGSTPILHRDFGPDWYTNNVKEPFRTMVRDFARSQRLTELTTNAAVTDQGQNAITKDLRALVNSLKLPVTINSVVIGAITPPSEVLKETASTAAQEQRKRTEDERQKAEVARKEAEIAKADADRAYATKFGMTPDQYLQYRYLENQREMIELVKDKPNVNVILNAGGGGSAPQPFFQVGK